MIQSLPKEEIEYLSWPETTETSGEIGRRFQDDIRTPLDKEYLKHYLLGVALLVVGIMTSFGNCIVLITFIRNASLRTSTYSFLMSLALADFVCSIWFNFPDFNGRRTAIETWNCTRLVTRLVTASTTSDSKFSKMGTWVGKLKT